MLARLAGRLADFAQRCVPDPFVIALGLTALTFALGWWVMPERSVTALASAWFTRLSAQETLTFTAQMALILVAGAALARAPLVRGGLSRLAGLPRTTGSAAALTAFVAMATSLVNWGFGLVAGAVLAREIGARFSRAGRKLDYPLVAAAGYLGLMIWHGGLSGSAPLKVAEAGPLGGAPIPLDETLFSRMNVALCLLLLVWVPIIVKRMASPAKERLWPVAPLDSDEAAAAVAAGAGAAPDTGAGETEPRWGRWLGALLGVFTIALGAVALRQTFAAAGFLRGLGLNTFILMLVLLGLLLFRSPVRYAQAVSGAASEAGGILLQFPFYFGLLGLLEASGLVQHLAGRSADMATALAALGLPLQWCFDMVTFLTACVVNMFVPSGGGQWAVQGSIVAEAAQSLHLPLPRAVMALAWGDEWSNMLQPFWALPLLAITGLKARDIFGYTLTIMLASGVIFALAFALFPPG